MPIRSLLRYLLHNERLIQRLADSYPIRRLARFCLATFYRTRDAAERKLTDSGPLNSYYERFKDIAKEMKNSQGRLKDKEKKN